MFLVVKINLARSPKIMESEFINYDLGIYCSFKIECSKIDFYEG